jgi:hypothetical protein
VFLCVLCKEDIAIFNSFGTYLIVSNLCKRVMSSDSSNANTDDESSDGFTDIEDDSASQVFQT